MALKTSLYDCHVAYGGKIVPFADYLLPIQYKTGIIAEHLAVRKQAGLFDVSHMGEVLIKGKDALINIQMLVTNDCEDMYITQVKYSPMCNEEGGIVDDLMVYKMNEEKYMLVINAANRHKDVKWIKGHLFGDVIFEDISDEIAQIALQGPQSYTILSKIVLDEYIPKKYYTFKQDIYINDMPVIISKTGYTGENGYEIYCSPKDAKALWDLLLDTGDKFGLIPCGLGARDTLRLEAAMPLYGHELNDNITPIEAGLSTFVKMYKEDFIGKKSLELKNSPKRIRVGLKMIGRGIARENYKVYVGQQEIGITTSGTHCPYLDSAVAMAIIDSEYAVIDSEVEVDIRGKKVAAQITKLPFYKKQEVGKIEKENHSVL